MFEQYPIENVKSKKEDGQDTYYERNKELVKSKAKEYYKKNRSKIIANSKQYIKEHPEKHRKNMMNYYNNHKDKLKEYSNNYMKSKYHNNENHRAKALLSVKHTNFLKGHNHIFEEFTGLSLEDYKSYIESVLPEGCDWSNYKKEWRIGHKETRYDPFDADDVKKFFNYKNIKILLVKHERDK